MLIERLLLASGAQNNRLTLASAIDRDCDWPGTPSPSRHVPADQVPVQRQERALTPNVGSPRGLGESVRADAMGLDPRTAELVGGERGAKSVPSSVVNIGVEDFAHVLETQGVRVIHVDWSPPGGGDQQLTDLLDRLI